MLFGYIASFYSRQIGVLFYRLIPWKVGTTGDKAVQSNNKIVFNLWLYKVFFSFSSNYKNRVWRNEVMTKKQERQVGQSLLCKL